MIIDGITFAQRLKAAGVQVPEHTVSITIEAVPNDAVRVTYETVALDEIVAACAEAALAAEAEGQVVIRPRPLASARQCPACGAGLANDGSVCDRCGWVEPD